MASIAKAVISNNTNRVTQTTADVIVLGAGIAGLQAANDIVLKNLLNNTTKQQQPTNNNHNNNNNNNNVKKIVVLEARNRIGGRIYTTKGYGPKNNVIEHGAQFVHGATNENPVVQLAIESKAIKKLKNLRFIDWDDGYVYKGIEGKTKQFSDKITDKAYESLIKYLNLSYSDKRESIKSKQDRKIDVSLGKEFIKVLYETKNNIKDKTCTEEEYKKLIECTARMEISDDYGVDLEDLSLAYWDQDDEYVYDRDCTFPNKSGGYETLINYLAKPLRDNILLNHIVQHIQIDDNNEGDINNKEKKMNVNCNSSSSSSSSNNNNNNDEDINNLKTINNSHDNNSNITNDTNNIVKDEHTITITCTNGTIFKCKQLICTIPLGYLKKHRNELFKYIPNIPNEITDAIDHLNMGNLEKVFLRFKRPFWKIDTDTFYNYSGNPFRIFMNLNRMNGNNNSKKTEGYILICFVSGSYAKSLITNNTDQEIALLVLASLREIFGSRKVPLDDKEALSLLLENDEGPPAFVTRWTTDPYSLGCYSHMPINALPKDYYAFEQSYFNNTFHFAGEHTIAKYAGAVHGAILSGKRAAKAVMKAIPL